MILKRLRRRFIFINMSLISLVLIGIFLANTASIMRQVANNSFTNLNENWRHIEIFTRVTEEIKNIDDSKKEMPPKAFPQDIIWIKLQGDSILILNKETAPDYSAEYIKEIKDAAMESNKEKGFLNKYDIRFSISKIHDNEIIIGFIDASYEQDFIYAQVMNYVLIGLGSLIVFFIISFFLSKIVIKPVENAFKQQQQFISDASHELKTPLTVILANTSIILNKKDDKNTNKWVNYIDKEANRMKKLVEDLLVLAQLDENENRILKSKFNLSDALYECALPFEPVAFEKGISLNIDIQPDVTIMGNIDRIKRLIMILLDNACKYSAQKKAISIMLKATNGKAKLSVHNDGVPIPQEDLSKIFDRFFRVDKARERNSNSYGLGLPMAKKIVENHGGNISVVSAEHKGTTFTVLFPIAYGRGHIA